MAKQNKNGLRSFPLNVDFFADERMVAVRVECGAGGQALAMLLLCIIFSRGYYIPFTDLLVMNLMGATGLSADDVRRAVHSLVKWGVFDSDLFERHGILTSADIQALYFSKKRKVAEAAILYRLPAADAPAENAPESATAAASAEEAAEGATTNPPATSADSESHLTPDAGVSVLSALKKRFPSMKKIGGIVPLTCDSLVELLREDEEWLRQLSKSTGRDFWAVRSLVGKFALQCQNADKHYYIAEEVKPDFADWLSTQPHPRSAPKLV